MFSILLAVYKKENPVYFSQSLDSIFSQILFPHEVVLVKDGPLTDDLEQDFAFKPGTSLRDGLRNFAEWYVKFYNTEK